MVAGDLNGRRRGSRVSLRWHKVFCSRALIDVLDMIYQTRDRITKINTKTVAACAAQNTKIICYPKEAPGITVSVAFIKCRKAA